MGKPMNGATDTITDRAVVLHQDRAVVGLAPWLAQAAVDAVRDNLLLQVVTPADGVITYPFETMLAQAQGQWVVRAGEEYRDGLTGLPLRWDGQRFATSDATRTSGSLPTDTPWTGGLEIQIVTVHPATEALRLGASTEAAVRALTGGEPTGWGVAEPATEPWSRHELTALCRTRAPAPTSLTIVGGEDESATLGVLTVERVDLGVREQLRLAGPPLSVVDAATLEGLAEKLAGTVRSMIVTVHPGRSGGLRSSTPSMPALPWGILVGHHENPVESEHEVVVGRAFGRGARRAWWYRLDGGPGAPYEALGAVVRRYGLNVPR
ncbi:DUF6177 family protein [Micromonospora sp. CA-249363]|uniref:DUF6177 family protein n=1 Tax=Micromonospora sp. CA-249363 TaxID=3239963 RepID=UPI003D8F07F2